jgi:hypothetical protein
MEIRLIALLAYIHAGNTKKPETSSRSLPV